MTVDQKDLKVQIYNISDPMEKSGLVPSDVVEMYDIAIYASQVQPGTASKFYSLTRNQAIFLIGCLSHLICPAQLK